MTQWTAQLAAHLSTSSRPLIGIVGPTASGKTGFSIRVCHAIAATHADHGWEGAEVVNADSRQFYRGMDIGTAKVTEAEREGVPHHVLDVLDPQEPVSIAWYRDRALAVIDDILARRKVPVLVGGSMLYVSAVIDGLQPLPAAEASLRASLQEACEREGSAALHARLATLDPEAARAIDPRNSVYVIRAVEICLMTGQPVSAQRQRAHCPYDLLLFGMLWSRAALTRRITLRTMQMVQTGWIDEVRRLLQQGVTPDAPGMMSHGYRDIAVWLQAGDGRQTPVTRGDGTVEALQERIAAHTRQYAKRQMTWWKRDERIVWLPPDAL